MRVGFVWQGSSEPKTFDRWNDGLRAAMRILESEFVVSYHEPWDDLSGVDAILYWEAPCTLKGNNGAHYRKVRDTHKPKALLFAGGPVEWETCTGFDLYFVESKINEVEFENLGLPWRRAFGVNTDIFKPKQREKVYDGVLNATFAGWKRHTLFADALGPKGLAVGRIQANDRAGYETCLARGVTVLDEQPYEKVADLINQSFCVVNTADFWGGGQRTTLEAMACDVPVIVMTDSPKNREYVEESGSGVVVEPSVGHIQHAIQLIKDGRKFESGREYVMSKWTPRHYADAIREWLCAIQS